MNTKFHDKMIDKKEASEILGVCVRTLERMNAQGLITIHQISKRRVGLWLSDVLSLTGNKANPLIS